MSKIVYLVLAPGAVNGGNKVTFRHVEALRALGFDAVVRMMRGAAAPAWFDHAAPIDTEAVPIAPDDILVVPEDHLGALEACAALPNRRILFCQNPFLAGARGLGRLGPETLGRYRSFLACSPGVAAWIARYFDYDMISVVPGFADERLFRPAAKQPVITCIPRKRPLELLAIQHMFRRLYPGSVAWRWEVLEDVREPQVATAMGRASVFLSLNRFEGMSLTVVEAMAAQCLVAGFTGLGPREYTSPINGLWVEEEDCEACARALVEAVVMAEQNSGPAALMRHAAAVTAEQWSHARFTRALETFWRGQIDAPHPHPAPGLGNSGACG